MSHATPEAPQAAGVDTLLGPDGAPRFGVFDGPVGVVDPLAHPLRDPFGRPVDGWRRRMARKHFQFIGALSPGLFAGCALIDLGWMTSAFAYAFEPRSGRMTSVSLRRPPGAAALRTTPEAGRSTFRARGPGAHAEVAFGADPATGAHTVSARFGRTLRIDLALDEGPESAAAQPMRLCTPTGATGWTYARKTAGVPVRGTVQAAGRTFTLSPDGADAAFGHEDFSTGFMRRQTVWRWGAFAGHAAPDDATPVGLNVSCGVNETSFTESCFWVGGRRQDVGPVAFDPPDAGLGDVLDVPWRVDSACGRVALTFTPHPTGRHTERLRAGIVASAFVQLFGTWGGTLRPDGGAPVEVRGVPGFAERQYAKW